MLLMGSECVRGGVFSLAKFYYEILSFFWRPDRCPRICEASPYVTYLTLHTKPYCVHNLERQCGKYLPFFRFDHLLEDAVPSTPCLLLETFYRP